MHINFTTTDQTRIERVCDHMNEDPNELVKKAVRRYLNTVEDEFISKQLPEDLLASKIKSGQEDESTVIKFFPEEGSQLRFKYFNKGDPPHTAILDTGNTYLGKDEVESTVEEISGIRSCTVPNTKSEITAVVEKANTTPLDELRDQIHNTLCELISEADRRVAEGEETRQDAKRRAVRDYWKYSHQIGR